MKLNLKRPLAFFDLETTGTVIGTDKIVELSILKVHPDGTEEIKTLRINPERPIPIESSLVHGIYDEDIQEAPTFKEVAQSLADFMVDCDLAGYNSNKFDIPMLLEEFLRAGVNFDLEHRKFVDVQNIFHQMEQRTLKAAYQFYCGKTIENAHSAEADIKATYQVLLAQLQKYQDVEWEDKKGNKLVPVQNDVDALHAFTNLNKPVDFAGRIVLNDNGEEVFNFGKHKGKRVEDVFHAEPSYYAWMQQGEFPLYTKRCLEKIWIRYNEKKVIIKKQTQTTIIIEKEKTSSPKPYSREQNSRPNSNPPKSEPITTDMLQQLKLKFGK